MITGASSGLGAAFARQLAARGADVVLVARRAARLEELAAELRATAGVRAVVLPCDLGSAEGAAGLLRELEARGIAVDVLVNNAGAGLHAPLAESSWSDVDAQLQLNVASLARLTHALAAPMRARGRGHILNVASIGAFIPVPGYATNELRGSGVRVCCLSPGGIDTEFFQAAAQPVSGWMKLGLMSPERCARIGLAALFGCRRSVVSGYANALGMSLTRFAPRWILALVAGAFMGRGAARRGGRRRREDARRPGRVVFRN